MINPIKALFRSRDKPSNTLPGSAFSFLFGGSSAGKTVNERTAMQTTAVMACVRILAETLASLPLHTYKYTAAGKEKALTHPLYNLLHTCPNPDMTSFIFRETLMAHLLIYGNAYVQILRDGAGRVISLYPLMPDQMKVDRTPDGVLFYEYRSDKGYVILRTDQILHIPGLGFDGLVGYSPIAMAKNAIGFALATEEYGAAFFANGANPGGVLEHPGVLKDPGKLRDSWNEIYRGSGNGSRVAVLEEGIQYKQISIPPEQAQFLQTRKYQLNEIARIFRIPPHMIGDLEKSSFSNIEQQSLEFVKYTLDPWVTRWEQAMRKALLLPSEKQEYFIKFNVNGLLRGDYKSRMDGYATGRQNGWLSANDIRELEDMDKIPAADGGDLFLVNGNMKKLNSEEGETQDA